MKQNFDYKDVPWQYVHCFNTQCSRSADCLRFKIAALASENVPHFQTINPAYANREEGCHFFQADQLLLYAYGITHLYDNLPRLKYPKIKKAIHNYFGHTEYYRVYNKLIPIKPEDQTFIRELFIKEGIETEPLFDEYIEQYDFFPSVLSNK